MPTTIGISPKVQAFIAALGGPGIILLILGLLIGDESLKTAGVTALAGAVIGGTAGYRAEPGEVIVERGPASDDLLPPDTLEAAAAGGQVDPDPELPGRRPAA